MNRKVIRRLGKCKVWRPGSVRRGSRLSSKGSFTRVLVQYTPSTRTRGGEGSRGPDLVLVRFTSLRRENSFIVSKDSEKSTPLRGRTASKRYSVLLFKTVDCRVGKRDRHEALQDPETLVLDTLSDSHGPEVPISIREDVSESGCEIRGRKIFEDRLVF